MSITQRCPACKSSRIRLGYRPTPLWSKLIFRYSLLCDTCNWQFTGFAVPGTVAAKSSKSSKELKKKDNAEETETSNETANKTTDEVKDKSPKSPEIRKVRRKIKIRI